MSKAKEFVNEIALTNKASVFVVKDLADDLEETAEELRFQANQAKRDPDKNAQEMLDKTDAELFKVERKIKQARKELGIT